MSLKITQVDAFSDKPFGGNPAAVCILDEAADPQWMQNVAMEMNLAETAFLVRQDDGYNLRWFTPAIEVDLCGHATLASAHVLWEAGYLPPEVQARFYTRSGLLTADRKGDWIELDFPARTMVETKAPAALVQALGEVTIKYVGNRTGDTSNYLVELGSEAEVRSLKPDLGLIRNLGVIVTAKADTAGLDFVSRYFAPYAGIDEDPVTGSAHCSLTPYWQKQLGKNEFTAYQASARGGLLKLQLKGERVLIGGQAVTVLRGELV